MSNPVNRPADNSKPKPGIFSLLKPYSVLVVLLIIMALLGSGINMLIPKIISHAIDSYTAGHFEVRSVVNLFLIAAVSIFIFTFLQNIIQTYTSERVAKDLRTKLSDKISHQSYAYILKSNPSQLLTNLTSDIDSVKMFVSQAFVTIISSVFVIVGTSVLLILINWKLALAVISIVPVIGGTFFVVLRKVRVLFKKSRENIDSFNKIINESIMGSALIRVLNSQQPESIKFLETNLVSQKSGTIHFKIVCNTYSGNNVCFELGCCYNTCPGWSFCCCRQYVAWKFCSFQQLSFASDIPYPDDRVHE